MTHFADGPAKGQVLMLKRSVLFLRVTQAGGAFDALDRVEDSARPGETLFAYQNTGRMRGIACTRGKGGCYPIAEYRLCPNQPEDAIMRDNAAWHGWCLGQPNPLPRHE